MFDFHTYDAHVVAARPGDGPFVARSAAFEVSYDGDDPQPPSFPNVAWSLDGDAATLEGGGAPGDGTVYVTANRGGASTLHAFVGPPANRQIDFPMFAYRSLRLGCTQGQGATGLTFAPDGTATTAESSTSDLVATGERCGTPARRASGIFARRGFVFVPSQTVADFATVSRAAWHAGGVSVVGFATYGTLLARLSDGRTIKFFLTPGGRSLVDAPYVLANTDSEFDDVRFLATASAPPSHRLPSDIRIPAATPRPRPTLETLAIMGAFRPSSGTVVR